MQVRILQTVITGRIWGYSPDVGALGVWRKRPLVEGIVPWGPETRDDPLETRVLFGVIL